MGDDGGGSGHVGVAVATWWCQSSGGVGVTWERREAMGNSRKWRCQRRGGMGVVEMVVTWCQRGVGVDGCGGDGEWGC